MSKDNGGPAFPCSASEGCGSSIDGIGMTLRDYFAAKAMQAMIAAHEPQGAIPRWAYEMADEMLSAREV
ncbi:hypothetical protein [Klebsiella oxytoca]|uniref:hypothetical protein n=1 Tax=Klebsiella oxytoca TaxID=571 RepID=UPI000941053C|nr:hypothetical protein [Klebsiella oxytoca]HBU7484760.1 hypothetical protein [Klebsiella oxytoca]HBV5293376.1 hypothetical protein [Klebsiella oxytoca]HCK2575442.1 hypothetical protein [Klebsiella oxytoca]